MIFFRFFAFFTIAFIFLNWNHVAGDLYDALFYNQTDNKLVEMSRSNGSEICSSCISACPADSSSEEQIIKKFASITENGLFLRGVYDGVGDTTDINTKICHQPPVPAIIWQTSLQVFGIGYEFFPQDGKTRMKCVNDYLDFNQIVAGNQKEEQKQLPDNALIHGYREENEKLTCTKFQTLAQTKQNFEFFWIGVFIVMIPASKEHRQIVFLKDTINDLFLGKEMIFRCENYFSGHNTETIPAENATASTSNEKQTIQEITLAEPEDHLEKTQIIPMHMFHTLSSRLATCMYINMAYIWNSIAKDRLKNIDLFLYAIYRLWPSEISISFGVATYSKKAFVTDTKEDWIFRQYPIPQVIFRVVEYKLDKMYDAIVVIHNDLNPNIPSDERICTTPVEGWHDITDNIADVDAPGLSYTCMMTKEVYEKLGIYEDPTLGDVKPLELNHFPKHDPRGEGIVYENVLEQIYEKLEHNIKFRF